MSVISVSGLGGVLSGLCVSLAPKVVFHQVIIRIRYFEMTFLYFGNPSGRVDVLLGNSTTLFFIIINVHSLKKCLLII